MEIVLSLAIIGKLFLFAIIALLLAFFILFPVEDQPTSNTQVFIFSPGNGAFPFKTERLGQAPGRSPV